MRKIEKQDWYGINRTHYHALYQDKLDQLIDNQNELIDFARTISKQHRIGKHHIPPVVEFPDKLEKRIAKLEDKAPPDITDGVLPEHQHRVTTPPKQREPKAQEVDDEYINLAAENDDIFELRDIALKLLAENAELSSYCESYRGAIFTQAKRISELEAENAEQKKHLHKKMEVIKVGIKENVKLKERIERAVEKIKQKQGFWSANYMQGGYVPTYNVVQEMFEVTRILTPKAEAEEEV